MDDKKDNKGLSRGAIPQLLTDALSVSFDSHIGHDFIEDAEKRFEFYHTTESRVPFDVEILNTITGGGLPNKTLNVLMAGVGVGKTLAMCHMAASHLAMGKRVLYVTLEMAEERIAERIDANLLNLTLDELKFVEKANFLRRVERLRGRTGDGRLVIKEYPTASAGASHIRFLLNELRIKRNFVPDIIYVDYINLCVSSRLKYGSNVNSYTYIKTIAEELRGLAVEINRPIVTATQVNRPGFSSSDLEMTDVAESFGLPATVDFMLALSVSEELIQLGQIMCKQLKNRYSDLNLMKRFVIGVDRPKMRLFNVEANAQENVLDGPVFDKSDFNEKETERGKKRPKYQKKNKFAEFS
jgi:predicted ATP-dependent serine protease